MKIVEIIILMGTQCVSPLQHTPSMTEVSKVQCAVVIEKDSVTSAIEVSPPAAITHPNVSEAMARLSKQSIPATAAAPAPQPFRIVPAAIARRNPESAILTPKPLGPERIPQSAPEIAPPAPLVQQPVAQPDTTVASLEPQEPVASETDEVTRKPEPEPKPSITKEQPRKAKAAPKARSTKPKRTASLPDRCTGNAKAKWYTAENGHKKYRCISASAATAKPRVAKAKKGLY